MFSKQRGLLGVQAGIIRVAVFDTLGTYPIPVLAFLVPKP